MHFTLFNLKNLPNSKVLYLLPATSNLKTLLLPHSPSPPNMLRDTILRRPLNWEAWLFNLLHVLSAESPHLHQSTRPLSPPPCSSFLFNLCWHSHHSSQLPLPSTCSQLASHTSLPLVRAVHPKKYWQLSTFFVLTPCDLAVLFRSLLLTLSSADGRFAPWTYAAIPLAVLLLLYSVRIETILLNSSHLWWYIPPKQQWACR